MQSYNNSTIEEIRKLFPVTNNWIYLYNGSINPCALPVREAMEDFLKDWQMNGESAIFKALDDFQLLKEEFADLIGADERNIVVTESTSTAINLAGHIIQPLSKQNIVVTELAFMSNTYPWLVGQLAVDDVRFAPGTAGVIQIENIASLVDSQTALIHLCAVTVASGYRFNMAKVSNLSKLSGVPVIIDAAQAVGVVEINVKSTPVDFLAGTASKWLMGPAGIGFLYVDDKYMDAPPSSVGWFAASNVADWDVRRCNLYKDAKRFQSGIPNLIGVVGALAGIRLVKQIGPQFISDRISELTGYLIDELKKLNIEVLTPGNKNERAGVVFFKVKDPENLHKRLRNEKIYCGCFQQGIRVDPSFYTTYQELDMFMKIVKNYLKNM
jgi:selenocysteine lyase/cysteine desulfurase